MNRWSDLLDPAELEAQWALTAKLDPQHAKSSRTWWEERTADQLSVLEHQAWLCCDPGQYQLARTYRAQQEGC